MNKKIIDVIEHNQKASFSGESTFPEIVGNLMNARIVRYYADLVALQKIYYERDGSIYVSKLPYPNPPQMGEQFSEKQIIEALRSTQQGKIDYTEFLDRIIKAGTVNYTVFIHGKQAHYIGAKGEIYIEHFPSQQ